MKIYINEILITDKIISVTEGWNNIGIGDNIKDITTTNDSVNRVYDGIEYLYYYDGQYYETSIDNIENRKSLWIKVERNINKLYLHTDK